MTKRLFVGVASSCVAPLALERLQQRVAAWMGIDSMMIPDHYQGFVPRIVWGEGHSPAAKQVPSLDAFFDPYVLLGSMAAKLPRRLRLGTGVTEPFRRHPVTLAQAFVTLDHLTKGRAICGIGNGERENTQPYGIAFEKRVSRLEEALEIMRRLWQSEGEPVDFEGRHWHLHKAVFRLPLYEGRPPCVWVAAHAPRMLGITGRYADGWYPTLKMTPTEYADKLGRIRAAAQAVGRDLSRFEPALQIMLVLGKNRQSAIESILRLPLAGALGMLLPGAVWRKHGLHHPLGDEFEGGGDFVPEEVSLEQIRAAHKMLTPELLLEGAYAGSVDEIVDEIRSLVDVGLRHVILFNMSPLATGGQPIDFARQWQLIRRLQCLG